MLPKSKFINAVLTLDITNVFFESFDLINKSLSSAPELTKSISSQVVREYFFTTHKKMTVNCGAKVLQIRRYYTPPDDYFQLFFEQESAPLFEAGRDAVGNAYHETSRVLFLDGHVVLASLFGRGAYADNVLV